MARVRNVDAVRGQETNQKTMNYRGKENHGEDWVANAHFGGDAATRTMTTPAPAPTTKAGKADDEEDNEVAPTPIAYVIKPALCKFYTNGRVEAINEPIPGFEHCRRAQKPHQGLPGSSSSRQAQLPGATGTEQPSAQAHTSFASQHVDTDSDSLSAPPRRPTKKSLKRSRSGAAAQGSPAGRPRTAVQANGTAVENDDVEEERVVPTETTKTFRMGEIEGLKEFFRHRIDELTMKPVRGMVTAWIKILEPKRQGQYGRYHREMPEDMPADLSPPWWPRKVPYIEPAHLKKDDLLTLAVEVMLQHRQMDVDEFKRDYRGGWTERLRRSAHNTIGDTLADHFSSSKNIVFSRLMKERAVTSILPSLFECSQTYEDYVYQNLLWNIADEKVFPLGKTITWQYVPRPPKLASQTPRVRRVRIMCAPRALRNVSDVDAYDITSGDDTEVDNTMEMLASKMRRRATMRSARERDGRVKEPRALLKISSPVTASATPHTEMTQPSGHSTTSNSTPNTSFGHSMDDLHLGEDVKGGNVRHIDNHRQVPRAVCFGQPRQYQGYVNNGFFPMQDTTSYVDSASGYIDPNPFFNDMYAMHSATPRLPPSMVTSSMGYHPYAPNGLFVPTPMSMQPGSPHDSGQFHGLPNDDMFDGPGPQQQFCGTRQSETEEMQRADFEAFTNSDAPMVMH